MKQLRLLTITFNTQIEGYEIPAFRGALAQKVGLEHDWFHNHNNTKNGKSARIHRYPRIQYKRHRGKPMLVCLENGVEEIHKYFSQPDWTLKIGEKEHVMKIDRLQVKEYNLQVGDKPFYYQIRNWIALNPQNYIKYKKIEGLADRVRFLEQILSSNIIVFAKGIDWKPEKRFDLTITELLRVGTVRFKGIPTMTFNCAFQTNIFLPNYVGVGKGVSKGFGTILQWRYGKTSIPS